MAAPTVRGVTAPAAGGSVTSPSSTAIGDMVIVFTFERLGAGTASTLTVNSGASFVQIDNQFHNDSSTDGAFGVAYKIATASGAQSYQGFTSSTGTPNWATGCVVLNVNTFDTTDIKSAFVSQTNNAVPNPPSVTLGSTRDWQVIVTAAWHLASSATVTPTAPANYTNLNHISGSDDIELAVVTRALTAAASEDPGTFGDDVAPNGTCTFSIGVSNPLPQTLTAGNQTITLTAPTGTVATAVTLAAGTQTATITAPTATLNIGGAGATLAAGTQTITITAPATTVATAVSVLAGTQTVTLTAPTATTASTVIVPAGNQVLTVTAPTATALASIVLPAGAVTITLTAPTSNIIPVRSLTAGNQVVVFTAPTAALSTAVVTAAGNQTITITAPTATLILAGAGAGRRKRENPYSTTWSTAPSLRHRDS